MAFDPNKLIGIDDKMVWHIPEDLNFFKTTTTNKTIVMGDTTFFGIGKPLPNRKTIILSLDKDLKFEHQDVAICNDANELIKKYRDNKDEDIYIAGGKTVYKIFLPVANELIVSHIKKEYEGNVYFPEFDIKKFKVINTKEHQDFVVKNYRRI